VKAKEQRLKIILGISLSVLALILITLLLLMTNYVWIVMLLAGIAACGMIISTYRLAKKNALITPILQVIAALLILALSVKGSLTYFANQL
ncbi:hypothetical protein SB749_19325, partial [Brevibacterium sp. SIMBA_078]|uniref:hypothetical protein n=1 Tax=Brevibacterium sp. SIMBA_078 TaxID=3085816 RepID=UPI00397A8CDE